MEKGAAYVLPVEEGKGWCNWWWVVVGVVGVVIVIGTIDSSAEETPLPPGEVQDTRTDAEKPPNCLMDSTVDATYYLGLEYDIDIDKRVLRTALEEHESTVPFPEIGEFDSVLMRIATWGDSPTAQSNKLKDVILDYGDSPRVYLAHICKLLLSIGRSSLTIKSS